MSLDFKAISSRDNVTYKSIKQLRVSRKARHAGLILIEGFRQVEEAIEAGVMPRYLLMRQDAMQNGRYSTIEQALITITTDQTSKPFEALVLEDRLFNDLMATESPQGIALVAQEPVIDPNCEQQIHAQHDGLYLVLEDVQDPGNLGTLIRTADAFAFSGVIIVGATADPFSDKALRSAMGSTFHLPLYRMPDIEAAIKWLKLSEITIVAADLSGEKLTETTTLPRSAALLIGNEGSGLSKPAIDFADRRLKISMPGRAESLNAAAAAAILCHWMAENHEISDK
ncbi:MAG: RNA methyltransferase [Eubacteriales bacterium]|nr:RNA methyltransferase [Eubacteriales bacterium]